MTNKNEVVLKVVLVEELEPQRWMEEERRLCGRGGKESKGPRGRDRQDGRGQIP